MKNLGLKEKFEKEIALELKKTLGHKNVFMAPRLGKITINAGLGRKSQLAGFGDKILPEILENLSLIAGQKAVTTKAKKSIASFKIREGQVVGAKVTLRKNRMYDFLDRLVKITLPRLRDFKGVDLKSVDKSGNLSLGIKESVVFPEISPEAVRYGFGLEITISVNARSREEAIELYKQLGIRFKK